jgi:hypothetical protein
MIDEIRVFLEANGFGCSLQMRHGIETISARQSEGGRPGTVIPLEFRSKTSGEAEAESSHILEALRMVKGMDEATLIIPEDRWNRQTEMMKARLLAHLEIFTPVYARNCEVRRIDKPTAAEFLSRTHAYGDAACKYRYGMFLKRSTGHIAKEGRCGIPAGTLIAVGTFSNARKWVKEDRTIRSYEWVRFASLPGLRISGGMGKILNAFIEEVQPDDIMSYADLEWSEGTVYEQLGFTLEGQKEPVLFGIDSEWNRSPVKPGMTGQDVIAAQTGNLFYMNFGSNKYRLKLTEYE